MYAVDKSTIRNLHWTESYRRSQRHQSTDYYPVRRFITCPTFRFYETNFLFDISILRTETRFFYFILFLFLTERLAYFRIFNVFFEKYDIWSIWRNYGGPFSIIVQV